MSHGSPAQSHMPVECVPMPFAMQFGSETVVALSPKRNHSVLRQACGLTYKPHMCSLLPTKIPGFKATSNAGSAVPHLMESR